MPKSDAPEFVLVHRPWLIAAFQAILIFCSFLGAWFLRFDFRLQDSTLVLSAAPILIVIRLLAIAYFRLLHGWWRYTGVSDALDIAKAIATGSVFFWIFMRYILGVMAFPRSVYVLEALLSMGLLAGVRLLSRALAEGLYEDAMHSRRVILIGAGFAAQQIIREAKRPDSGYAVVGCLDDDPSKQRLKLDGIPILGTVDQLGVVLNRNSVDEVLIAVPSATGSQMRRFIEVCNQTSAKYRTVPAMKDIIAGNVSITQLREVNLEDLLGRDPAKIDLLSVRQQISGQSVLVTGAAGSIGSELCRQILDYGPARLVCLDQNETGLFYLNLEISGRKNGAELVMCVADIGDLETMKTVLAENKSQIIFHAAAYKHVPLMEKNVKEAIRNNVLALSGFLCVAEETACKNFVLISSDKAVNPTNVMGATKRVCELILASRQPNCMRCVSVRFGNVLGSSGSVVPVLQQQLRENRPLTITHPDVKRFFMSTQEAVALVLQGFAIGSHGDILVLDMGQPVRILDLARTLIRLSGKQEKEVPIQYIGLREGEKFQEELFYPTEVVKPTSCEKIKRIQGKRYTWTEMQKHVEELQRSLSMDGAMLVRRRLKDIVPEYSHHEEYGLQEDAVVPDTPALRRAASSD